MVVECGTYLMSSSDIPLTSAAGGKMLGWTFGLTYRLLLCFVVS